MSAAIVGRPHEIPGLLDEGANIEHWERVRPRRILTAESYVLYIFKYLFSDGGIFDTCIGFAPVVTMPSKICSHFLKFLR